jgi:hypothetical protein
MSRRLLSAVPRSARPTWYAPPETPANYRLTCHHARLQPAYIDAVKNLNGVGIDDRKFLLEKLVTLMSRLPDDNQFGIKLQQFVCRIRSRLMEVSV